MGGLKFNISTKLKPKVDPPEDPREITVHLSTKIGVQKSKSTSLDTKKNSAARASRKTTITRKRSLVLWKQRINEPEEINAYIYQLKEGFQRRI